MITACARAMMQRVQESTMQHTCSVEPYIVADDGTISYGAPFVTECGFNAAGGNKSAGELYESVQADATMRLPLGRRIGVKDRVTILTAYGDRLHPAPVYEVSRIPDRFGPSGSVVELTEIYS